MLERSYPAKNLQNCHVSGMSFLKASLGVRKEVCKGFL